MMPTNSEMTRMMENGNRMMEGAMQRAPSGGTATSLGIVWLLVKAGREAWTGEGCRGD